MLRSITLQSPGTLGLNTQDSNTLQDPRFCTQADNCIIDENGLLQSRKGQATFNSSAASGTPTIDVIFSYIEDDGSENMISVGGNKIYTGTAMTDRTGALTVTSDNWQFQNYAGEVFGYNGVNPPVYWDGIGAAFLTIASKGTAAGVVSSGVHLSAYGRSWVVDTTTVSQINYSDLLVPEDFTGGSSGSIDLNTVWPYSNDTITALAAHNNNLIIFCENSIVIYGSANNINSIYLVEVIKDIGCIARDSVQNIGDDILFLSKDGVRSLGRTILQDNMPQKEISNNIRDEIIASIAAETASLIRSTYNEKEGFYIITFPTISVQWVCDVRKAAEGIFRWTKWKMSAYSLATSKTNSDVSYIGLASGWVAKYSGYYDMDTSDGSVDQTYLMKYRSGWIDPGFTPSKLVWKNSKWYTAIKSTINFIFTWAFDFANEESTYSVGATAVIGAVYGTGVYGTAVYGGDISRNIIKAPMSKTGSIIKIGAQCIISGASAGFNKVDLFFKTGQIR